ncbi:Hsp70 family protein [Pseudarthrobacter sp. NPDC058329]|uniref:Hsp70 family protein n=1 Tax=Pseudarthrobacter sp. NPDC058329 TaxID=3346448 RepID=UPI0036D85790
MNYVLAIDVGTSFTAAAIARLDQGSSPSPECLPLGLRGASVPSVIYYPEVGTILVGEAAERRGLDSPARVVREFKRRVGDSVPISVGTLSLPAEDVFATMVRWVADRAEEREGAPPSEVVLTHPAAWGGHRTSVIRAAMAARGLENVTLIAEPEAAAVYYASQVRVEEGSTIAVYDLGGGTFDTAVLRKAGTGRFELVGRPEGIENLGGADFDAEVFRYVAGHTGDVLSKLDPGDAGVRGALARLRRECVEAKEALSADSEATISVLLPGVQQQVRLVRSEFEALITDAVRDTVDALEQSLTGMALEPADLTAVLLIGGSSRIPLVAQLISEQLDRPLAVDADPKSSICMGAAVSAVLARAEVPEAGESAAGAAAVEAGFTAVGLPADPAGHVPERRASWSRKGASPAGAVAAGAAHGHGHGGAHAPKPAVRVTAIAAAAALFSVLTATAAQSPEGFGNLTAMFIPDAEAADGTDQGTAPGPGNPGGGSGAGQGAAAAAGVPVAGIEAGANQKAAPVGGPGLNVAASPTSRPSSGGTGASPTGGAAADGSGTTGAAAGGAAAGPQDPAGTTGPLTGDTTGPGTPAPGTTAPGTPSTEPPPPPVATEEPPPPTPVTEQPPPVTEEPPPVTEEPPPVTEQPPPPPATEVPTPVTEGPPPATEPPVTVSATETSPAPPPVTTSEPAV